MKSIIPLTIICISAIFFTQCEKEEPPFVPVEYIGDIIIDSEDDAEFLQDFYDEGYNSISGNLKIISTDNVNLSLLSNIMEVKGNVGIASPKLLTLSFLNNLKFVNDLSITNSPDLESIRLENLRVVKEGLTIMYPNLKNDNNSFPMLDSIGKRLYIHYLGSPYIIDFPQLKTVGEDLYIINVPEIDKDYQAFPELISIGKDLYFNLNRSSNIMKFPKLESVERFTIKESNSNTMDITPSLIEVENIEIVRCPIITNLDGFQNLKRANVIEITDNSSLISLEGLEGLIKVNSGILIRENSNLVDFCAIPYSAIDSISGIAKNIKISGNGYNPTIEMLQNGQCSE